MDYCLFISCCRTLGWLAFSEVVCPVPSGGLWWQQWRGRFMNRWWKKWAWNLEWLAPEMTSFTPSPACCDQLAIGTSQFHRGVSLAQPGGRKAFWDRGSGLLASKEESDLCVIWSVHSRRTVLAESHGNGRVSTACALCSPPLCMRHCWAKVFEEKTVIAEPAILFLAGLANKAPMSGVDSPCLYALFSPGNIVDLSGRLDVSLNAYNAGVGGREMKCWEHSRCHQFCTVLDSREGNWNLFDVSCIIIYLSILTLLKCASASAAMFAQGLRSIRHFRIDCCQSCTCSLKNIFFCWSDYIRNTQVLFNSSYTRELFASYYSFVNPWPTPSVWAGP